MTKAYVYKPVRYFTTAFAATFVFWGAGGYMSFSETLKGAYMLPMLLGLMAPAFIAWRMISRHEDKALRRDFVTRLTDVRRINPGVFGLMLLMMPLSVVASIGMSVLFGGSTSQFAPAGTFSFSSGFVPVLLLLVVAATFEEVGWRGYGFESLQERLGFRGASLMFGVLWSGWHLPLLLVHGSYQYEILQANPWYAVNFYVSTVLMGVIISWVCAMNRGSILAAIVFHFMINISQEALSMTQDTKSIQTGVLAVIAVLIVVGQRRSLPEKRMTDNQKAPSDSRRDTPAVYTIHVGAMLGQRWTEWFDGAEIVDRDDGTGLITASIRDQAMLFGLLIRVRDLGVPLLGLYPGRYREMQQK